MYGIIRVFIDVWFRLFILGEVGFVINDFVVYGLLRWYFGVNLGNRVFDLGKYF